MQEEISSKEPSKSIVQAEKNYSDVINFARDLPEDPIMKTNCKLCNSIYRAEAENMFTEGKSAYFIFKYLKSKGEDISDRAVHNHFEAHYKRSVSARKLKYYAENLEEYAKIRVSQEKRLELYSILLDKQVHELASSMDSTKVEDLRKNQETLIKIIDQAVKVQEKIQQLREQEEPVKIVIEKINSVLTLKFNEAKDPEVRKVIKEIVNMISEGA